MPLTVDRVAVELWDRESLRVVSLPRPARHSHVIAELSRQGVTLHGKLHVDGVLAE